MFVVRETSRKTKKKDSFCLLKEFNLVQLLLSYSYTSSIKTCHRRVEVFVWRKQVSCSVLLSNAKVLQ